MLILTEEEVRSIYSMKEAIADIEQALQLNVQGLVENPERTVINYPKKRASALFMPSAIEPIGISAVKVVTIFPDNPAVGKKTTQGVILLSDTENGDHLACMDASYLTRLRTGAASGAATKKLAKEDADSVAVIGCGRMAEEQLQAVLEIRPIQKILLFNRTKERAEQFAGRISGLAPTYSGAVQIVNEADFSVREADIVICSTRSETPVFSGEMLRPGTHINGVGSYLPHMQEVDEITLQKCSKIVVDTIHGVKEEAGDFIIPEKRGAWDFSMLHGELGELVSGLIAGRESEDEITFFKSVGIAYFDLVVAAAVFKKAKASGVGTEVNL
ncbi:ornithine cyclodeaminase family protein [Siminovitchia sp. 179-K 8D1 HS]|uniref:ornithine cyclodeaminase family protein n=1 Tax=Siminovitchia sp. 179-K 8D1 HS TaxID=3142385 RepID=UPI0039A0DB23